MGDRHDYVALDWVKGEISATLNQARQALESFVENPGDSTRLRFCLTYIHQVHGTLQMVEFYGAALLAEEMEKLAQALMHGSTSRESEALDVLMQAILQLPTYLDRVQTGRRDLPLVLLPLLNDMRTARGENLLSENALFTPDVDTGGPTDDTERLGDFAEPETVRQLRKLRQAMQFAHAGIIRSQDVSANARQLGKVFARLQALCQGSGHANLWAAYAVSNTVRSTMAQRFVNCCVRLTVRPDSYWITDLQRWIPRPLPSCCVIFYFTSPRVPEAVRAWMR
jgi:chemosensory pili system protein ChpA (sensor histidine kinase/response regulator)